MIILESSDTVKHTKTSVMDGSDKGWEIEVAKRVEAIMSWNNYGKSSSSSFSLH